MSRLARTTSPARLRLVTGLPTAEAAKDQSEIFSLIREVGKVREMANAADEAENAIYARCDRPEYPVLAVREVPYKFQARDKKELGTSQEIDEMFDQYAEGRRLHFQWLAEVCEGAVLAPEHAASLAQQLQEGEEHRERAQRLYSERAAAYNAWELASGYLAAQEVTEARWNTVRALDDRILRFPCTTVEEIAAKGRYIITEYGMHYPREKQHLLYYRGGGSD